MESINPSVRIVGRYALYGTIAAGGMATVHFGRLLGPVGFSRTVAIKRLHPQFASDPEFVSMFLDEARLAARIRHPHVVPTLDVVATNGELFLVMDYVPGESLSRLIRTSRERGERIPINITIAIMSGVLQGLHAAHEARNERGEPLGIVRRDVSPQNVLVGSDGQSRVLDFGVAKAAGRVQTTREGQLKGKLAYMAPEQLRSETLTRKTDIYAAAVVLWEALVCDRLFGGDNEGAVVTKVLQGAISRPSQAILDPTKPLDPSVMGGFERLDEVVMRGLDRDSAKRYESAREMALALEKCFTPATAAEVSDWVERIASTVLMHRAGQIAEIESGSASIPSKKAERLLSADLGAGGPDAPTQTAVSSASFSKPRNVTPNTDDRGSHSLTQVSSISVASNALSATQPSARSRRIGVVLLVAALITVPMALYGILHRAPNGATIAEGSSAATGAAPDAMAGSASLPADSARPTSEPPGSSRATGTPTAPAPTEASTVTGATATTGAAPAADAGTGAQRVPRLPSHPYESSGTKAVVKPPSSAPKDTADSTAAECNPPYTWDSEGRKHYKPKCL